MKKKKNNTKKISDRKHTCIVKRSITTLLLYFLPAIQSYDTYFVPRTNKLHMLRTTGLTLQEKGGAILTSSTSIKTR